jgi:biopolymer transport protein ExbB
LTRLVYLAGILVLVTLVIVGAQSTAAAPGAAGVGAGVGSSPDGDSGMRWFDFFVIKGGWIAWMLILLSVVAIALTIEHSVSIRRATIAPPLAAERIRQLFDERQYLDAVRFTADEPSMMGWVVHAGLAEAANGYAAMERAVEDALEERAARLLRKIEYLNVIGSVSPMIGLFGTVYGMILLFASIRASNSFPEPQIVADKISIALITTFWGLAVAIPSLSIFALFRNRIDVLVAECALVVERLLRVFKTEAVATSAGGASQGGGVNPGGANPRAGKATRPASPGAPRSPARGGSPGPSPGGTPGAQGGPGGPAGPGGPGRDPAGPGQQETR